MKATNQQTNPLTISCLSIFLQKSIITDLRHYGTKRDTQQATQERHFGAIRPEEN
jgi:hypothetical protein